MDGTAETTVLPQAATAEGEKNEAVGKTLDKHQKTRWEKLKEIAAIIGFVVLPAGFGTLLGGRLSGSSGALDVGIALNAVGSLLLLPTRFKMIKERIDMKIKQQSENSK